MGDGGIVVSEVDIEFRVLECVDSSQNLRTLALLVFEHEEAAWAYVHGLVEAMFPAEGSAPSEPSFSPGKDGSWTFEWRASGYDEPLALLPGVPEWMVTALRSTLLATGAVPVLFGYREEGRVVLLPTVSPRAAVVMLSRIFVNSSPIVGGPPARDWRSILRSLNGYTE